MSDKIYWQNLTRRHKIHLTGKAGSRTYVTGRGRLIYWHGQEARAAQMFLNRKVTKTENRRKFEGKYYSRVATYRNGKMAKIRADQERGKGHQVRLIKSSIGYGIWVRRGR